MLIAATPVATAFAPRQSLTGPTPAQPAFDLGQTALPAGDTPGPDVLPGDTPQEEDPEGIWDNGGTEDLTLQDPFPSPIAVPTAPDAESTGTEGTTDIAGDGTTTEISAADPAMRDLTTDTDPATALLDMSCDPAVADIPLGEIATPPTDLPDAAAPNPTPPARPDPAMTEKAAEPARQQAEAAIHAALEHMQPDDAEDLGRIHISLHRDGDDWRVTVSADNPETLDLMRRHADQLQQDLARQGFEGAQLDFSDWGDGERDRSEPRHGGNTAPSAHYTHTPESSATTGLDLRL